MSPQLFAFTNPVKFGDEFELNPQSYELRRAGRALKLERIPMELLFLLIEQRGQLVTRDQIIERIWGKDVFLDTDTSINSAVRKIRQVLKDNPEQPRFLQTVAGRGYRFIAAVEVIAPPADVIQPQTSAIEPKRAEQETPSAVASSVAVQHRAPNAAAKKFWVVGFVAAGLLIVGFIIRGRHRFLAEAPSVQIRSIAVLPLENLTGDPGEQYFTDGMTDALITDLAQIGSWRVISRTSSMHYRDSSKTLPQIANELGVDAVVEGSVARSGNRVRIDAQLIEAAADRHLWAKSYERDARDVLALQGDLAGAIASQVQNQLTPKQQARLGNSRVVNPEAYEAYLKARFYWNKRTSEGFRRAIEYFNDAWKKDPNFAAAQAGVADTYALLASYQLVPVKEAYSHARVAAAKALALDDSIAEAHVALAMVKEDDDWDLPGAEHEFKRAIELNPNYATAHHWYGNLLIYMGQLNEGLAEIERARQIDPLSLVINATKGYFLVLTGPTDLAIEQLRKTLDMDPNFAFAHWELGIAYVRKGALVQAIPEFRIASRLEPEFTQYKAGLGHAYARAGNKVEAYKVLDELKKLSKERYVSACDFAIIHAGLGESDQALAWLERAYRQHDWTVISLKEHPLFDPLRSDPRFQILLHRIGLAP
jgi:TolB-like protein/DNA-binding winged helix-turn-helix (wHTH) protein/Tfp pilus assembly protein PilF